METLEREKAFILWDEWWNEMQNEWFKIEVLQDYSGEDEGASLAAWLLDDKEKSIELMLNEMKDWIAMCRKSPAQKRRFRIIQDPRTPYTEWEIELYKRVNIPLAGEIIHLVQNGEVEHLDIPDGDVMIFDEKRVVKAYYDGQGRVEKMDFYEQPGDDISNWLQMREDIMKCRLQTVF